MESSIEKLRDIGSECSSWEEFDTDLQLLSHGTVLVSWITYYCLRAMLDKGEYVDLRGWPR